MARFRGSSFTSLDDLARDWNPPGEPGVEIDRAISRARSGLPRETDDGEHLGTLDPLPAATAAALEAERPGVLPTRAGKALPGAEDALAALLHELGVEFLDLWAARLCEGVWDEGHDKRLRGALAAAAIAMGG